MVFCILVPLFAVLMQPSAWRFNFGTAPTSTPVPPTRASSILGLDWIATLGLLAIMIGGGGLVILGAIWLALKLFRLTRSAVPVSPARMAVTSPLSKPAATPSAELTASTVSDTTSPPVPVQVPPSPTVIPDEPELDVEAHSVMSKFEQAFFWTLLHAVRDEYYIFPQIRLRELVSPVQRVSFPSELSWMWYKGMIDFLLVNPTTLDAILAIEFDDPSHRQSDAQARDRRKDQFLLKVGSPLLRIESSGKWDVEHLHQQIQNALVPNQQVSFLDNVERQIYHSLRQACSDWFVFPRVPLNQIIRRKAWLSEDVYKTLEDDTVDFLLAHPRYLGTLLVIERGDSENGQKNDLLNRAGIQWIELGRLAATTPEELRVRIAQARRSPTEQRVSE